MFILDLSPTYEWPVVFVVADPTGGTQQKQQFDAVFKRLTIDQIDAVMKSTGQGDDVIARQLLANWKGVCTSQGAELPFNDSNLSRVLAIPGVGSAVVRAFFESQPKAAEKN